MKRSISLALALIFSLGLTGFTSVRAGAERLDSAIPLEALKAALEDRTSSRESIERNQLPQEDLDKMVRVVVELTGDSVIETATKSNKKVKDLGAAKVRSLEKTIRGQQANVKNLLNASVKTTDKVPGEKAAGTSLTIAMNGFSTYMRLGDLEKASQVPGVSRVLIANEYERPDMDTSVHQIAAPTVWTEYDRRGEGTVVAIIDSGIDPSHQDFVLSAATDPALTESLVNAKGLDGRYYTEKVPYAYNYYDLNQQVIDRSTDGQHGMHVAGTVAANGLIKGVAPEAQLLGMKVFSDDIKYATTFSDIYLKAIDDSIALGADAINMSLGSPAGFYVSESMEDIAINHARDNGVTVAISAGNERNTMNGAANFAGYLGIGYARNQAKNPDNGVVGSPSVNSGSLSVASFDNIGYKANTITWTIDAMEKTAEMLPAAGSPLPWEVFTSPVELVYAGLGSPSDFEGKDLTGKVALIMRGNLNFKVKLDNAVAAGAAGVIIYNNAAGGDAMVSMADGDKATVPYVFIGYTAGNAMASALQGGQTVSVVFNEDVKSFVNPSGGLLSSFSSWGSTPNLKLKPEVSAPGGMIYSTQNSNGYTSMSGTSMAAPHVSGGAALVAQRIEEDALFDGVTSLKDQSALAKTLLMNTAIPQKDRAGLYYDTRQQGAGMMNLANAMETTVTATNRLTGEPKVELGAFRTRNFKVEVTLRNYSDQAKVFQPETILLTDDYGSDGAGHFLSMERTQNVPHSVSSLAPVTVPANGSKTVKLTINFDEGVGKDPTSTLTWNQYLGGYVRFVSQDGKNTDLTVPVLGFYGDWEEPGVLDEWVWNLDDSDPTNDPEFQLTSLVNATETDLYFLNHNAPIWINPESDSPFREVYGTDTVGLLGTMLRNAEEINFRVTDAKGTLLRNVGQSQYLRKIYRMSQGAAPYRYFTDSEWDGTVAGRDFNEGETVYYEIAIRRTLTSPVDRYRFPVRFDNLGPVVQSLSYDPVNGTIELDAADAGSGVAGVLVYSSDFSQSLDVPSDGSGHFSIDVSSLKKENPSMVYVIPYDWLMNLTYTGLMIGGSDIADLSIEAAPASQTVLEGTAIAPVTASYDETLADLTTSELPLDLILTDATVSGTIADADWADGVYEKNLTITFTATDKLVPENKVSAQAAIKVRRDDDKNGIWDKEELPEPPVRPDDAYGKPEIVLDTPDLLMVYGSPVPFSGKVYGWDDITRVTYTLNGEEFDLDLIKHEKSSVLLDGSEVFFGTWWEISDSVKLTDDYYELPITMYNEAGESFSVVRRFWVDTTAPAIEVSATVTSANKAQITLTATDNLFYLELYQADSLLEKKTLEDLGFGSKNVTIEKTLQVSLNKGENVFTFIALDSAGNRTVKTITVIGGKK
ncbi:Subtilase family protein [anaerobic digester metagenome]